MRNQHPYVINYISAKSSKMCHFEKKKEVYSWCYRNREWYLVIFSDSSKLGFSQNLDDGYNICINHRFVHGFILTFFIFSLSSSSVQVLAQHEEAFL
jgi:hypothetical protein